MPAAETPVCENRGNALRAEQALPQSRRRIPMKIDKTNPGHWLLLALFGLNVFAAMLWRPFRRRRRPGARTVVLYGHKLSGNLLAIYRRLREAHRDEFRPVFLTMDSAYR